MKSIRERITPGKWEVIYELNVQAKDSGRFICACGRNSPEANNHDQNMANAELIAASPEMLDILERLAANDQRPAGELCSIKQDAINLLKQLNQ